MPEHSGTLAGAGGLVKEAYLEIMLLKVMDPQRWRVSREG